MPYGASFTGPRAERQAQFLHEIEAAGVDVLVGREERERVDFALAGRRA